MSDKVSLSQPLAPASSDVPTEIVPLPSNGSVYPQNHPLHGCKTVSIRSMTARDEDILTSRALLKSGRAITMLLKSCLIDKNIDPGTMIAGDRNAVLVAIRITGYGRAYGAQVECPECRVPSQIDLDLASIPIKRIPDYATQVAPNEFTVTLPSGKPASVRLMTGNDQEEIMKNQEALRKANLPENAVTTLLRAHVVSYGTERDPSKLSALVQDIPAKDSRALRKFIDTINPDVELKAEFKCSVCGFEDKEVPVPMSTDFFWPAS